MALETFRTGTVESMYDLTNILHEKIKTSDFELMYATKMIQ